MRGDGERRRTARGCGIHGFSLSGCDPAPRASGWKIIFPTVVADAAGMEEIFRTSRLDWTMVRPPQLTNHPHSGKYRVREGHLPAFGFKVSRANVAEFMVKCAEDAQAVRKIFGVSH